MKNATSAQIVASDGAGKLEHFYEAVEAGATVLLAASVFHFHMMTVGQESLEFPIWRCRGGIHAEVRRRGEGRNAATAEQWATTVGQRIG